MFSDKIFLEEHALTHPNEHERIIQVLHPHRPFIHLNTLEIKIVIKSAGDHANEDQSFGGYNY